MTPSHDDSSGTDLDAVGGARDVHDGDFAEVLGQEHVKRALLIAAAGALNLLLIGPPGAGKTMLVKRLPTILPPLTTLELSEATRISSVARPSKGEELPTTTRPVRQLHHSISTPALVGGGIASTPGEVSLAHGGVLFLDDLPEFSRSVLEALPHVMDRREVVIPRANDTVSFPADFLLVAAMKPCPCGHFTDPREACACSAPLIDRYLARLSGKLMERIDMHIEVPAVPIQALRDTKPGTDSATLRAEVVRAHAVQRARFDGDPRMSNARMHSGMLRKHAVLDDEGEKLLRRAVSELGLSARAHDKVLRVARTIADLAGLERIEALHLSEAIQYRRLDRAL